MTWECVLTKRKHFRSACYQQRHTRSLYSQARHMSKVYIRKAYIPCKCMSRAETWPGREYSQDENTLAVYVANRDTPRECMPLAETNPGSVCYQESHFRKSVCLQERHTLEACVSSRGTRRKQRTHKNIFIRWRAQRGQGFTYYKYRGLPCNLLGSAKS